MTILATILSGSSLLMSVLVLIRLKFPQGFYVMPFKMMAVALSPYWAIIGLVGVVMGWFYQAYRVIPLGIVGAGVMIGYVWQVTRNHNGFEQAFGAGWSEDIPPEQTKHMVKRRWSPSLKMKASCCHFAPPISCLCGEFPCYSLLS